MSTAVSTLDERTHFALIAAALAATLGEDAPGVGRVYDYGTVPGSDGNQGMLPSVYALVSIERRYVEPARGGRSARSGWRVTIRYVGRTVSEARWAGLKVAAALNEQRFVIGGEKSTPLTHESTNGVEPDDGLFSGSVAYTYAL